MTSIAALSSGVIAPEGLGFARAQHHIVEPPAPERIEEPWPHDTVHDHIVAAIPESFGRIADGGDDGLILSPRLKR
ncbi:MAG: hypothetical protein ACREMY_22585, partial [bacterium]